VFDVSWPRKPLQITMAGTDLTIFQKKTSYFSKKYIDFVKNLRPEQTIESA
jgi:hypothetical protein